MKTNEEYYKLLDAAIGVLSYREGTKHYEEGARLIALIHSERKEDNQENEE